uniref:Uncharacterized protein n=1 Tax=Phytophthora ramorum TaxID=164328 RepID=H3H9F1_PHYRM
MVTETYFRKALAQSKNKHSLLEEKHALLENEYSQVKIAHSKLQEEHAELLNERNDLEGDTWLWMMQNNKLQAQLKELQGEHAKWKAACASLVKEVERKVLEEEYLAYLAQEYDQTHWPVAKVAELEVEQERKLAEADQLAKEREQALMAKAASNGLKTLVKFTLDDGCRVPHARPDPHLAEVVVVNLRGAHRVELLASIFSQLVQVFKTEGLVNQYAASSWIRYTSPDVKVA